MIREIINWLCQVHSYINSTQPVSRVKDNLVLQTQSHHTFQETVDEYRPRGVDINKRGVRLSFISKKKDATAIKNQLNTTITRWSKVLRRTADRARALDNALCETQSFLDQWNDLHDWCCQSYAMLTDEAQTVPGGSDRIRDALAQNAEFRQILAARQSDFNAVCRLGKQLKNQGVRSEQCIIDDQLNVLKSKWSELSTMSLDRQRKLEEALLFSGQFNEAVANLLSYLGMVEQNVNPAVQVHGDLDTVNAMLEEHKELMNDLKKRQDNVETIHEAAQELKGADVNANAAIDEKVEDLEQKWALINDLSAKKLSALEDALQMARSFHDDSTKLMEFLGDLENRSKTFTGPVDREDQLQSRMDSLEELSFNLTIREQDLAAVIALGNDIRSQCHPKAEESMRNLVTSLTNRWDQMKLLLMERGERLKEQLKTMQELEILLEDLMGWMVEQQIVLSKAQQQPLPPSVEALEKLLVDHYAYENNLQTRQLDVDEVTKGHRKAQAVKEKEDTKQRRENDSTFRSAMKAKIHRKIGNPKVKLISDRWRDLWLQAMDYKKKLTDALEYEREVRRLKDFSFDEWRVRYLKWINHKKSRVMDFFRRLDNDCDGLVTRDEFVDGFLASKFPTSRVEMSYVADMFDRGDGCIDYMAFIDALRADREPTTEAEKIKDEVLRQAQLCTCDNKYRIKEIGNGKYKFGEQMRLVRILRSTVMVRVGGGWVSLTEYLMKYDPCRAKGRTNIELREKFILPEGASQTMWRFRSKVAKPNLSTSNQDASPGPIVKIREKTERSLPMYIRSRSNAKMSDEHMSSGCKQGADRSLTNSLNSGQSSRISSAAKHILQRGESGKTEMEMAMSSSRPPSRASTEASEYSTPSRDSLNSPFQSRIPSLRQKKKQHDRNE